MEFPSVTIVIPCFNEKDHIEVCLDSVLANDYPADKVEVLIIDGISEDGTREILKDYARRYSFVKILDNPKKITPAALNIGIKSAKGEIIVRMDAHSTYEKSYISKCVKYLNEYGADNVGGIWITVPRNNSLLAKAIALSLSHYFGVGNAHYRIGCSKEPRWVDTVPFGCFRREIFEKIGFFDENFHRNEDTELNARLRRSGGKILLAPEISSYYRVRSDLKSFVRHVFDNGQRVTYHLRTNKGGHRIFSWRHLIPLAFVTCFLIFLGLWSLLGEAGMLGFWAVAGLYFAANFYYSAQIAAREKNLILFFLMPCMFTILHFTYGTGSIWGCVKRS